MRGAAADRPAIGIAHSGYTSTFLERHPDSVDYVEIPFELLRHDSTAIEVSCSKPVVLHCASMSMAGSVPPSEATVAQIQEWIGRTGTPWLGEHLSFITADRSEAGNGADEYAPGEPYNIGYTVSPPMNDETVDRVLGAIGFCDRRFAIPLILENPPLYFVTPGSTMTQTEFIVEICARSRVGLLLDLAHFYISSQTMRFDPLAEIDSLPLERVVEAHISGVDIQGGAHWDNHAGRAPEIELELLRRLLERSQVQGVTLEYNWSSQFPMTVLLEEIGRVRTVIDRSRTRAAS
jgi:uncharacterized protein